MLVLFGIPLAVAGQPTATPSDSAGTDGVTFMWKGPAPELHTSVLIIYLKPEGALTDGNAVDRQVERFWSKWRTTAEKGPYGFVILKVTNANRSDIEVGHLDLTSSFAYQRDKDGHLGGKLDPDTLSRLILWEGRLHGSFLVKLPDWLVPTIVVGVLVGLVTALWLVRSRRGARLSVTAIGRR
jgi:hypothetical protein